MFHRFIDIPSKQISCVLIPLYSNSKRSMYENPYTKRFKEKSKAPKDASKKSTGLTGMFVDENPHRSLRVMYNRILRVLEGIPADAAYRRYTENVVMRRMSLLEEESDILLLEQRIGMGQIEELLEQAEYELETARHIRDHKAWEKPLESLSDLSQS